MITAETLQQAEISLAVNNPYALRAIDEARSLAHERGRKDAAEEILTYVHTRRQRLMEIALTTTSEPTQERCNAQVIELDVLTNKIKQAFNA